MKTHVFSLTALVAVFVGITTAPLQAQVSVKVDFTKTSNVKVVAGNQGEKTVTTALFQLEMPVGDPAVLAFCIELQETIGAGTHQFVQTDLENGARGTALGGPSYVALNNASFGMPLGGIGTAAEKIALLFDTFYSPNIGDWTTGSVQAFQLAVWEFSHGSDANVTAVGDTFRATLGPNALIAQTLVDAVETLYTSGSVGGQKWVVTALVSDKNFTNNPKQDLLYVVAVPEPNTITLAVLGAIGAIFVARRRHRRH